MKYSRIVILTGAGISAESGIRTFRGADGLWENHRLEEVATPEAFAKNPQLVQRFYNERRRQLLSPEITPNAAHRALAQLEKHFPGDFLLVTQNIDDLHECAGSRNLIHMHGELLKARCAISGQCFSIREDLHVEAVCPCCKRSGTLRPHVVWFGEMPLEMERIYSALADCDLFVSIGTSGNVYPAAGFVECANRAGAHSVELNLERSSVGDAFAEHRHGPASQVVTEFVRELLGGQVRDHSAAEL
ncbi:Sir2 family NAD+-dependent deacetylase [Microbulbifer thermotolerans]|uniref:NAD-dependent protein deacylase n=1 Tax=Microbulbifer thermotolerans TaxID=252514 RepID=A0A143HQ23_MICTH|nr:Sir2 family NAD+-dependent deacetylase [Microbulbifer thermotolerans]AMX03382.1 NAD-dependent protein deacylase [Microbulbifer thermotolerans]MCX2781194.1 NAD-dependent protein deacylase [Microbulbifer thermotolerans]MCX2783008.1 NAD-dependent protein deacylase [Microbulbifer thermotolerans]MCX2795460.1 NAD-dependent protein deacylase [Microbulbifer thermotolerans]MCX2803464.1 NAD-dependent protein deacylase [Microbulbifer thermotolerans]